MEKKNRYHPDAKLGETYLVVGSDTGWMPAGTVVRVYDGEVHGDYHKNYLYFVSTKELWDKKPAHGHTGVGLTLVPYPEDNWEEVAKEMLG